MLLEIIFLIAIKIVFLNTKKIMQFDLVAPICLSYPNYVQTNLEMSVKKIQWEFSRENAFIYIKLNQMYNF